MESIRIRTRPLPEADRGYGPRSPHGKAICRLKPGQSFTAPISRRASLSVLCVRYGRRYDRQFVTRKQGDLVLVYRVS